MDLTCAIQLDLLHEPVTWPCGHTFCKECSLGWANAAASAHVSCPTCRTQQSKTAVTALAVNVAVQRLVDERRRGAAGGSRAGCTSEDHVTKMIAPGVHRHTLSSHVERTVFSCHRCCRKIAERGMVSWACLRCSFDCCGICLAQAQGDALRADQGSVVAVVALVKLAEETAAPAAAGARTAGTPPSAPAVSAPHVHPHPLQQSQHRVIGCRCDVCGRLVYEGGAVSWACLACDFDCCGVCLAKSGASPGAGGHSLPSALRTAAALGQPTADGSHPFAHLLAELASSRLDSGSER